MARIVVTTIGSAGDLNPFIAVGLELRTRGHDVHFAVEERMRPPLEELGFAVHHLSGDGKTALAPYSRQMFGAMNPFASVRVIVWHYILPTLPAKIEELRRACEGADLLVSAAVQIAAGAVADLTRMPWASIALTPVTLPSAYLEPQPPIFPIPSALQRIYNRSGWAMGDAVLRQMVDRPVNAVRRRFGLEPRRDILQWGNLSTQLTTVAVSPAFVPRPPDWPAFARMTGFCFWDTPGTWREPPELTAFLAEPGPVVAVSTGSMAPELGDAFARFYQISLSAILRAGARALAIGADPSILPDPLPGGVYALPFAPFSQIYPRCAAVIHHGGIGTTAQGLRAGIPALVIPWGADQFFDGAQVRRIGAGLWMQRRFYNEGRATCALDALLHDARYAEGARAVAAKIAAEDGPRALCDALEG
jgi:UDP:flavonoid glycosyltransferase YjiC (YdhE family)